MIFSLEAGLIGRESFCHSDLKKKPKTEQSFHYESVAVTSYFSSIPLWLFMEVLYPLSSEALCWIVEFVLYIIRCSYFLHNFVWT